MNRDTGKDCLTPSWAQQNCGSSRGTLTKGGMCPRCIWPLVICCWAGGMLPTWKFSGPEAPERMMAGRATEPCSTFPTRLYCC